jgi:hypothetical protein
MAELKKSKCEYHASFKISQECVRSYAKLRDRATSCVLELKASTIIQRLLFGPITPFIVEDVVCKVQTFIDARDESRSLISTSEIKLGLHHRFSRPRSSACKDIH